MTAPSGQGPSVVIDCFAERAELYRDGHTIVAIDVIRATTLAITAIATGRRCLVAHDVDDAFRLRDALGDAVLAGEIGGFMPAGFDMNNSPSEIVDRSDVHRPLIMLSSSGTGLLLTAGRARPGGIAACLRNISSSARHLRDIAPRVAIIGAGSRGEFREEDKLGCARLASALLALGYRPEDHQTVDVVAEWGDRPIGAIEHGNSAAYLRRSGQSLDLAFTTEHVDDLDLVAIIDGNEVRPLTSVVAAP